MFSQILRTDLKQPVHLFDYYVPKPVAVELAKLINC
jgi:hypothetical protein